MYDEDISYTQQICNN